MELLEGATLREELNLRRQLNPSRTIEILRGVCAAVNAAHRSELIHRDLKPENIFLARSGDGTGELVKVLDFGIAKSLSPRNHTVTTQVNPGTQPGVLVGTPAYMSPEQLLGESPDVSWDLWALSVVVYEALTGALPFPFTGIEGWRRAILDGSFMPLTEHLTAPSTGWQAFFARGFAGERRKRPRSAEELLRQLETILV